MTTVIVVAGAVVAASLIAVLGALIERHHRMAVERRHHRLALYAIFMVAALVIAFVAGRKLGLPGPWFLALLVPLFLLGHFSRRLVTRA
jgi:hypothetical protein